MDGSGRRFLDVARCVEGLLLEDDTFCIGLTGHRAVVVENRARSGLVPDFDCAGLDELVPASQVTGFRVNGTTTKYTAVLGVCDKTVLMCVFDFSSRQLGKACEVTKRVTQGCEPADYSDLPLLRFGFGSLDFVCVAIRAYVLTLLDRNATYLDITFTRSDKVLLSVASSVLLSFNRLNGGVFDGLVDDCNDSFIIVVPV